MKNYHTIGLGTVLLLLSYWFMELTYSAPKASIRECYFGIMCFISGIGGLMIFIFGIVNLIDGDDEK